MIGSGVRSYHGMISVGFEKIIMINDRVMRLMRDPNVIRVDRYAYLGKVVE